MVFFDKIINKGKETVDELLEIADMILELFEKKFKTCGNCLLRDDYCTTSLFL